MPGILAPRASPARGFDVRGARNLRRTKRRVDRTAAPAHHPGMAHKLYAFRFRDPVTRKWVRARYRATPDDIARRYDDARIEGDGVVPANVSAGFDPFRTAAAAESRDAAVEPALQLDPDPVDALE